MGVNLDAIRAAVVLATSIAEEFQSGTVKFYVDGNPVPVLTTTCRYKKPKPSSFDAGNQTEWSTKRLGTLKIPMKGTGDIIKKGLIVQISTPDGDPAINHINFTVLSSLGSQFAAERSVELATEVTKTARIS